MPVSTLLRSTPKLSAVRTGAGAVTGNGGDSLGTSYDYDDFTVDGANAVKVRFHHAQSDSTSISLKCADVTTTSLTSGAAAPLLSIRQSSTAGSGSTAGGYTGATATVHVVAAADEADDVLFLALGGTVTTLRVYSKRTAGSAIAGNKVQLEVTPVEG